MTQSWFLENPVCELQVGRAGPGCGPQLPKWKGRLLSCLWSNADSSLPRVSTEAPWRLTAASTVPMGASGGCECGDEGLKQPLSGSGTWAHDPWMPGFLPLPCSFLGFCATEEGVQGEDVCQEGARCWALPLGSGNSSLVLSALCPCLPWPHLAAVGSQMANVTRHSLPASFPGFAGSAWGIWDRRALGLLPTDGSDRAAQLDGCTVGAAGGGPEVGTSVFQRLLRDCWVAGELWPQQSAWPFQRDRPAARETWRIASLLSPRPPSASGRSGTGLQGWCPGIGEESWQPGPQWHRAWHRGGRGGGGLLPPPTPCVPCGPAARPSSGGLNASAPSLSAGGGGEAVLEKAATPAIWASSSHPGDSVLGSGNTEVKLPS